MMISNRLKNFVLFSLLALTPLENVVAAAPQGAVKVPSSGLRSVAAPRGKLIQCAMIKGKWYAGRAISKKLFLPVRAEIKNLKAEAKVLQRLKSKKKLQKVRARISELSIHLTEDDALCSGDSVTPSPTPSATPTATPLPPPSSEAVSLEPLARAATSDDVHVLLERAGFGLSSAEEWLLPIATQSGISAAVDAFMTTREEASGLVDRVLDRRDGQFGITTTQSPTGQRQALFDLWVHTANPYAEKLAIFLLSVWTVGGDVISDETFRHTFWNYFEKLRSSAYSDSSMPDLGVTLTRDPLMLVYLNNELNVAGNPNENYARELMELFTLSPTNFEGAPNYTETATDGTGDIAVAARMLTGWKVTLNYMTENLDASYVPARHQAGPHTMFAGTSYAFSGEGDEDLVRGIFAHHPFASQYYAREILKQYLTPEPPKELVERVAESIRVNNFKLRPVMRTLLQSQAFYHPVYKDTLPKDSVEFAVESTKLLGLQDAYNAGVVDQGITRTGMPINQSPSVFWFNPTAWTSLSVSLERANLSAELLGDMTAQQASDPDWSPQNVLPPAPATAAEVIEFVRTRLGLGALTLDQVATLTNYMNKEKQYDASYTNSPFDSADSAKLRRKGLGVYYILMTTSGFQLK